MSDRSKVPEGYRLQEVEAGGITGYVGRAKVQTGGSRAQATAACWAHRDAIIREELERLRDEMVDGATGVMHIIPEERLGGLNDAIGIVNDRLRELEDPK